MNQVEQLPQIAFEQWWEAQSGQGLDLSDGLRFAAWNGWLACHERQSAELQSVKQDYTGMCQVVRDKEAELLKARKALLIAKDALYNPFEPDNQSKAYLDVAALTGAKDV